MTSRRHSKVLEQIVEVRLVQRSAVEDRLGKAEQTLKLRRAEQAEAATRLAETESRWAQAMAGSSIPLHTAASLGAAVLEDEDKLMLAQAAARRAKTERHKVGDLWRTSYSNEQAAISLAKAAVRREMRHDEEAALHEVEDRVARRGSS